MPDSKKLITQVLIIGGGVTGTGIARDLSLRGIDCIVLEKQTINAGASGRNHGLLHSGARYVLSAPSSALECKIEGDILKKIAPHCIEDTGGLYVACRDDEGPYIDQFPQLCKKAGIPCKPLSVKEAVEMEPALSPDIIAAYRVQDASVEPFHVSLENMNQAVEKGARYFNHCRVDRFICSSTAIKRVLARDLVHHRMFDIKADIVINAGGAWAGIIASMAGINLNMLYSKGSLLITHNRLTNHVINRLRPPSDGDILVPGGTVSIFGTTSLRVDDPDRVRPNIDETRQLVEDAKAIVPQMAQARYIRAYAGVRPLVDDHHAKSESTGPESGSDDRSVSRGFVLIDHEKDGKDNLITITGGKMTTFRLMAEKTCDLAAAKLGVTTPCVTHRSALKSDAPSELTEAGMAIKLRSLKKDIKDITMCECEMITRGQFKTLISWLKKRKKRADLNTLRIHSRLGKGACQATFCSQRVTAFMYDEAYLKDDDGIFNIKDLLAERFIGQRPVLWDAQLAQFELNEALYCGFYGLELEKGDFQ